MTPVILVVDDEPFVLNAICGILKNAGFSVLPAASAEQAMEIGRRLRDPIRLMVCDVVMPGVSGPRLAEAFAEVHPETACLFIAGLPDTPEVFERILARGRPFLAKPFVAKTLLEKVDELLSASVSARATTA